MALCRGRGTTLVELLVSLMLVGIFSASLLNAIYAGRLSTDRSLNRAAALGLARSEIELLHAKARGRRGGNLQSVVGTVIAVVPRSESVGPFQVTRSVSLIPVYRKFYQVSVQVVWQPLNGTQDELKLECWIYDVKG